MSKEKLIVALDVPTLSEALALVEQLHPYVGCFKVGLQLLTSEGSPKVVNTINEIGGKIFYDGKFCDIPNTVGKASAAVSQLEGIKYFNVHASCGIEAMIEAVKNKGDKQVLAVTVLTSLGDNCISIFGKQPSEKVYELAIMAKVAGVDGIICSPKELTITKDIDLKKITPGIRPVWAKKDDQQRITTPSEAITNGAYAIVIGRPITNPPNGMTPVQAAQAVLEEIN